MPRQINSPSLRLFISLTIGVATIWLILFVMGVAVVESVSQRIFSETLHIALDGEPLLERYVVVNGISQQLPYKTLTGTEVPRKRELATLTSLLGSHRLPWSGDPIKWDHRILWCEDDLRWFVVRDAAIDGRAYLVAYNRDSKLPSQYLSRAGSQLTPPAKEDYFEVGPRFSYSNGLVTGTKLSGLLFSGYFTVPGLEESPERSIYLFDRDDLFEIKLKSLSPEKLATISNPVALTLAGIPVSKPVVDEALEAAADLASDDNFQVKNTPKSLRLVIRTADRVLFLNPINGERTEYQLPPDLHSVSVNVYPITNERLVVEQIKQTPTGRVHGLTWLSPAGEVLRTEEVTTNRGAETSPVEASMLTGLAAPLAVLYAPVMGWLFPIAYLDVNPGMSFSEALLNLTAGSWYVSLGLLALSFAIAAFVYRWQRENNRPRPVAWAVAAFLLGVPGFIAYLILHGKPSAARARTRKIATTEPQLLGIEIFA